MYIKTILKYFNSKKASLNQNSLVKDRTKMVMPLTASFYFLQLHNVPKIQTVVIWKTVEGYLCHFGYSTLFTTNIRLRPTRTFHIHDLSHPFCIPITIRSSNSDQTTFLGPTLTKMVLRPPKPWRGSKIHIQRFKIFSYGSHHDSIDWILIIKYRSSGPSAEHPRRSLSFPGTYI